MARVARRCADDVIAVLGTHRELRRRSATTIDVVNASDSILPDTATRLVVVVVVIIIFIVVIVDFDFVVVSFSRERPTVDVTTRRAARIALGIHIRVEERALNAGPYPSSSHAILRRRSKRRSLGGG